MKVLIWIGCFIVATILNTILGYATGIKVGYLLFYFAVYFVAKKLCSMWDEHKWAKESKKKAPAQQKNIVVEESAKITDADQVRFCRKCGEKLIGNSKFCRKCGTEIVVVDKINNATPSVVNQTSDTIWICGKCKAKNLDSRNSCWSCDNPK